MSRTLLFIVVTLAGIAGIHCTAIKCTENEVYSRCTNGGCDARNCSQVGRPVPCIKLDPKQCIRGCVCKPGYLRTAGGKCVTVDQCSEATKCGDHEELSSCTNGGCSARNCSQLGKPVPCVRLDPKFCIQGCVCKEGYLRDASGQCVKKDQCDEAIQCTENEVYSPCTNGGCDARNCSQVGRPVPCIKLDPKQCIRGCVCKQGYLRTAGGKCVTVDQCSEERCSGPHEYYSCGGACDNVCATLDVQSQTNCPIINIRCNDMCYCEEGYARDSTGICIPIEDCP